MTAVACPVVCFGGANVDRKLRMLAPVCAGSSNPASAREGFGGVARNVAENLARSGVPVRLLTAVGDDGAGRALLDDAARRGIDIGMTEVVAGALTGSYTAVLDTDGSLHIGLAHMDLCERLTPAWLAERAACGRDAALVVADLNLPTDTLAALIGAASAEGAPPLVLVAVSEAKMRRLPGELNGGVNGGVNGRLHGVRLLVLNRGELTAWAQTEDLAEGVAALQTAGVQDVVVTRGAEGLSHTVAGGGLAFVAAPVVPAGAVVDVTGAGDALAAVLCRALLTGEVAAQGWSPACERALARAALTVQSASTVAPMI